MFLDRLLDINLVTFPGSLITDPVNILRLGVNPTDSVSPGQMEWMEHLRLVVHESGIALHSITLSLLSGKSRI